jgi:uncharacterized OsmC-like protein
MSDQPARLFDPERHRREWDEQRSRIQRGEEPAEFTVRASVELIRDYLKEARVLRHRFRSDERPPGGGDEAPNPMAYFVAAVGF